MQKAVIAIILLTLVGCADFTAKCATRLSRKHNGVPMVDKYHFSTLNCLVEGLCGSGNADLWWNSPNKAFNNRTPLSYMNEAEWKYVRDYLMWHAYGAGG